MSPTPFPSWGSRVVPASLQSPGPAFPGTCPWPRPLQPCPTLTGTTLDVVEVESYDPYTDTWTPVSPALKYVSNFSAASCQGRLYLVGSSACKYNALALQCYNPVTGGEPSGHEGPRGGTRGHLHRATAPPDERPRGLGTECPRAVTEKPSPRPGKLSGGCICLELASWPGAVAWTHQAQWQQLGLCALGQSLAPAGLPLARWPNLSPPVLSPGQWTCSRTHSAGWV